MERLDGDVELLRDLAALYSVEYPKQLKDLRNAVAAGDVRQIQQAAHKINGTARNFAAAPATEAAQTLERIKDFGDGSTISKLADRLSHELRRLQTALEEVLARH